MNDSETPHQEELPEPFHRQDGGEGGRGAQVVDGGEGGPGGRA